MGSGTWTDRAFATYATEVKCMNVCASTTDGITATVIDSTCSAQDMFTARGLDPMLNPKNAMRECIDTEEHPNTIPIILALDVTGSMNDVSVEIAKKLNVIMTNLYEKVQDVEFMIMGIGDLSYDRSPIQVSQFESDIRIAEQLDKVWFENGGGGNSFESYTAAWYMASRHTKLDCHKRGRKGIIITIGDEMLNPYLPKRQLEALTGDILQDDVETKDLYKEVINRFNIYHLDVNHGSHWNANGIKESFMEYLDKDHFKVVNLNSIVDEIINIVQNESNISIENGMRSDEIAW